MNKLTVGVLSHMSFSHPYLSSFWSFKGDFYHTDGQFALQAGDQAKTSDPQHKRSYMTSDCCDGTPLDALPPNCQRPKQILDYIREFDDIIFSTVFNDS